MENYILEDERIENIRINAPNRIEEIKENMLSDSRRGKRKFIYCDHYLHSKESEPFFRELLKKEHQNYSIELFFYRENDFDYLEILYDILDQSYQDFFTSLVLNVEVYRKRIHFNRSKQDISKLLIEHEYQDFSEKTYSYLQDQIHEGIKNNQNKINYQYLKTNNNEFKKNIFPNECFNYHNQKLLKDYQDLIFWIESKSELKENIYYLNWKKKSWFNYFW
jgi:hypothetical protein